MMTERRIRSVWIGAVAVVGLCTVAFVAERRGYLTAVRLAAHNLITPSRHVLLQITAGQRSGDRNSSGGMTVFSEGELYELQQKLLQSELQRRQLLIENAKLRHEAKRLRLLAHVEPATDWRLVDFASVTATVLTNDGLKGELRDAIIDAGRDAGIRPSELVVSGAGLLLDRGSDDGFATGGKVTVGAAVVGRILKVSRWVSLVQPVTDPEFSAAVQIVSGHGPLAVPGPRGILQGTGDGSCRITGIAYTEAISAGDQVFSAEVNGVKGPRLYYGTVARAEFSEGGEWKIEVQPAVRAEDVTTVSVIRTQVQKPRH